MRATTSVGGPRRWLDRHAAIAPLAIRVFMGVFLLYMSHDNVVSTERMREFEGFLRQFGFPLPALAAPLSVYVQFLAGAGLLLGLFTRAASALLVVNFLVALAMVHTSLPFREALDPSAMLAGAVALLFMGPGRLSVDAWLERRSQGSRAP